VNGPAIFSQGLPLIPKTSTASSSNSDHTSPAKPAELPLVLWVRREDNKLVFEMDKQVYTSREDVGYQLGELALDGKDRQVAVIIEDTATLSDLKEIPVLALNAGFRKISVFLSWKRNGLMTEMLLLRKDDSYVELLYKYPAHFSKKPKKIQKYLAKDGQP
jgi:hypothetical protein